MLYDMRLHPSVVRFRAVMLMVFFAVCISAGLWCEETQRRILVLNSYSTDYQWTNAANSAILDYCARHCPQYAVRTEFMDTKNAWSDEYFDLLVEVYREKYRDIRFSGIIATDNDALDFLLQRQELLFPGVPVVACGINNADASMARGTVVSVIAEEAEHRLTIEAAIRMFPSARTLHIIRDDTTTGRQIMEELRRLEELHSFKLSFVYHEGLTVPDLLRLSESFSASDLVYMIPYFRSPDGLLFPQGHMEKLVASQSAAPVLVSWHFQMNTGALGGFVLSAEAHSRLAAKTMFSHLDGTTVSPFQHLASGSNPVYDFQTLRRFGVNLGRLPGRSSIINGHETLFSRYRVILIPAGAVIVILSLFVFLLMLNLSAQKKLNEKNRIMLQLDREMIKTQRELVLMLGEVIEARSHETGNHVVRVAKIARFLGDKAGIDESDLVLLEAAAPLHDIGKIGISEEILNKPGALTPEEFERMKLHTLIGARIFGDTQRPMLKLAKTIAAEHHERWDGTGYPRGLKGEAISLYARITAVADVIDALSNDRCYKKAWPVDRVFEYLEAESGRFFDPSLISLCLAYRGGIVAIQEEYASVSG